ncbi:MULTISPECIES: hypothetical protein [Photorhabdus]|uniref:Uncharacterized protein n=1 Tax=Photorhabdus bodei TaxID=2029681 RepID=A0AAW6BKD4_9GAMM|nr:MULTISPECIES: hypothetical protein [Photorhabdus]MCT8354738.1 hypothetical protein [Photorhabdus kayaii]MDB6368972.1 hypothetical protein [Photorhabdus bodei]MDB6372057.1 hypothetical protein [Photorhabdus bodei]
MTGMSACRQQRGNLKDNGYIKFLLSSITVSSFCDLKQLLNGERQFSGDL